MSNIHIYLDFDETLQQALNDNGLDVADLLRQADIDAQVKTGTLPAATETARTKDLVPLILASSTAVVAISLAISKVLNTLYNKPILSEYEELVELRDPQGNVMLDKQGKPLFKRVPKREFIVPATKNPPERFEISFDLSKGLVIRFSSGEKP